VGNRPKGYLTFLAKIWKLAYIKPSVPVFGRFMYKIRVNATTPDQLNISYLPVNAALSVDSLSLPRVILEGMIRRSEHRIITHRCTCRDAWKCKNYDRNIGCIHIGLPTAEEDAAVAHHASVEEAIAHLRRALAAGLVPFIGHVSADNTIWNVSKDRPFTTVCFCCRCCCTNFDYYRHLPPEAQACIHRLHGVTVGVDRDRCIGCGKCAAVCWAGPPFSAAENHESTPIGARRAASVRRRARSRRFAFPWRMSRPPSTTFWGESTAMSGGCRSHPIGS
jgi:ferredoxin